MRRRDGLVAVLLLVSAAVTGCGGDDGGGPGARDDPSVSDSPSERSVPLRGPDLLGDEPETEPTTITSYDATFDVDAGGRLDVVESVTVLFPQEGLHGIFRYWDRVDPHSEHVRAAENIEVTADGAPAVVEVSDQDARFQVARIGDPETTLAVGEHLYEISYEMADVLTEDGTIFYWSLVPSGWRQPIADATLTVALPADAVAVECGVGNGDDLTPCEVEGVGSDELTVHVSDLAARTGVTIRADLG